MARLKYALYYLDRKLELERGKSYTVGRSPANDVVLPGLTVSRRHAAVSWRSEGFVVEDTHSANGLLVNGRRLKTAALADGDQIAIGTCYLVFREFAGRNGKEADFDRALSDTLCIEHQMAELLQAIGDSKIRTRLFALKRSVDRARLRLDFLANRDRLTRLYNRRYFDEELDRELERARRYRHPLSLFMLDLDRFKDVNDEYGHRKGDQVLAAVAAIVRAKTRRNDMAVRYGGEEIAVVIPQLDREHAAAAAEKLRALIEREAPLRTGLPVTASIGVAFFHPSDTAGELVGRADEAMYMAKKRGRNRVVLNVRRKKKNDEKP